MDPFTLFRILKSPRLWKALGIVVLVLALLACLYGIYHAGVQDERERLTAIHSAEVSNIRERAALDLAEANQKARAVEQESASRINQLEATLYEQNELAAAERDRLLAAVHAGERRLRDRFTCPAADAGRVPEASAGTGSSEQAASGGLQPADVDFLVRLASEADAVTRQLTACQGILAADRKATE